MKIAPSLLSADFLRLQKDIEFLNRNADLAHLDIMDGCLVPNISFGFSVVDALKDELTVPMDAHLMIVHPERWFERFAAAGVSFLSFHLEASGRNTAAFIEKIHSLGMKAGVAVNPDIPVRKLFKFIGQADYFLIMSVFAGFGGQKFIYESLDRVASLKEELIRRGDRAEIEVDGGVGPSNAAALRQAGADILVAGNAIFKAEDPESAVRALREA
ncbi:MAG: ribulose-phosphate 3-epimerase [Bacteroidales bacterium]|nr:ribulose-phosphate 3-epimerase [Bacteroidales bacterium]